MQTAELEIENHITVYGVWLKPAGNMTPYRGHHVGDITPRTKLVIYDFGGMLPGNDLMEDNSNLLVKWAADNPKSLVVIASSYTFDVYIRQALDENNLGNLPNLVLSYLGDKDPYPEWWRIEHDLLDIPKEEEIEKANNKIKYNDSYLSLYDEKIEEELAQTFKEDPKEPVLDPEPKQEKFVPPIVGYITLPVKMWWKPGQSSGTMNWKLADCIVDVTDDETGEKVASLGGEFYGHYSISFPNGKGESWQYKIITEDFFARFAKLHKKLTSE